MSDIEKLIKWTTIIKVEDNKSRKIIFGDEYYVNRFQKGNEKQVNLIELELYWKNKWKSFGDLWNEDRQKFRFLQDSFRFFYLSFEQLRFNKISSISTSFSEQNKSIHFNELAGVSLYGIYHHGKKCIDLLDALKLINKENSSREFIDKFSMTRDKLIEHNHNPWKLKLQLEPSIWSLMSTNSLLEIHIHEPDYERSYDAFVDYYEDYYMLEKVIAKIIRTF